MKKNRSLKNALGIFSLILVAFGVGVSSFYYKGNTDTTSNTMKKSALKAELDPTTYDSVSSSELIVSIKDYTGTSLSRHLDVQFESVAISAFTTTKKDVYFVVDDVNYSGDKSNPFIDEPDDKTLNGFVYQAEATTSTKNDTIYIPSEVSYGTRFKIKVSKIAENCMSELANYSGITTIYIASGIDEVESGAFVNVPDTVTIKCQDDAKPAGWADDWTDATNIEFGAAVDVAKEINDVKLSGTKSFGDAKDFILGYKGNDLTGAAHIDPYPLTLRYEKTNAQNQVEEVFVELPTKHTTNLYDAVGSSIFGNTNGFQFTVDLGYGESIVEDSFVFYNIFYAVKSFNSAKSAWPEEYMNDIYNFYEIDAKFPSLPGEDFSYQEYETGSDKYITIHSEYESDEAAALVLNQFVELLDAEVDENDEKLYALDEKYVENKYGSVYRRDLVVGEEHYAMYVQLYVYEKHFISYFFVDHLVPTEVEATEETPAHTDYVLSRNLQIYEKQSAVKPYNWVPDFTEGYYKAAAVAKYGHMVSISEIFDLSYSRSSSFLGYTSIGMDLTKKFISAYIANPKNGNEVDASKVYALTLGEDGKYYHGADALNADQLNIIGQFRAPQLYIEDTAGRNKIETNYASVLNGTFAFRYVLTDLNNAALVVTYQKDGAAQTKQVKIVSPSPVIELANDKNFVSFLVNSSDIDYVNPDQILALGVTGVTVNIHLYNSSTNSVVQNTNYLKVFGNIEVLPLSNGANLKYFNINTYLLLFVAILVVAYAVGTVVLFFYQKNKYKNDEFRRMKPKAFIKTALAVFLGILLISLGVNFIVLRFAVFGSSVPVFNPIDPFVIVFGIAMAISIGLFIRMFIIMGKANKKIREAKRLRLDKDIADDGTH